MKPTSNEVDSVMGSTPTDVAGEPAGETEEDPVQRGAGAVFFALTVLSLFVAFAFERGQYIADNRFVDSWAPQRLLDAYFSVWNTRIDVGGPEQHYQPVTDVLLVTLKAIGLDPWLSQRMWFATVLAIGTIGTARLARALLPGARWEAGVAGAWFICAPYTSGFFFPTSLLLNVALAPWFALAVWFGTTTRSTWRWAAVFALCAVVSGTRNPPGLMMALVPAAVTGVVLVAGGGVRVRRMVSWCAVAIALAVAVMLPALMRTAMSAETLARNLGSTESVDAVSLSSSWSESARGLGFWLQYWNPNGPLVLPYLGVYFTNPFVVIATFVPPAVALATLAFGRRRVRLALGAMLSISVALMVGAYPIEAPSPLGRSLVWAYDAIPPLFAFRNVYKAGAGLVIGVGVLIAMAINEVKQRHSARFVRRWPAQALAFGVVAVVFTATGWPLMTGNAFRYGQRLEGDVPVYWDDAFAWLDAQQGSGRVLVLPGSRSEDYRWGSAGNGDLFPSLLDRPAIAARPLTGSPAEAANLTAAFDRALTSGRYEIGTLAPIARRLGVQFVLIRNDLDWQQIGVVRPSGLDQLRDDPDLVHVGAFGEPGENVTRVDDDSPAAMDERSIAPVEIFAVNGVDDVVRAVSPAPAVLLSGDGAAWIALARSGVLDERGSVRAIGSLDGEEIEQELAQGASVVISDTNRRRPVNWGQEDRTLSALDTENVDDLYGVPGSQSVATYGDASRVWEAGPPDLFDPGAEYRAAAAFDGDAATSWLTGSFSAPGRQELRIELARSTAIDEVRVRVAEPGGGRTVTRVAVVTPDSEPRTFDVSAGIDNVLRIPPTFTDVLAVVVVEVVGAGSGLFGLSEVSVEGLDLSERVAMPEDLAILSKDNSRIAELLESSPITVEMQRLIGDPRDTENSLARRFRYPARRSVDLSGSVQIGPGSSEVGLAELLRSPLSVAAQPRTGSTPASDSFATLDGDPATSWKAPRNENSTLGVRSSLGGAQQATIVFAQHENAVVPELLRVRRGGLEVEFDARSRCARDGVHRVGQILVAVVVDANACSMQFSWPSITMPTDDVLFTLQPGSSTDLEGQTKAIEVMETWIGDETNTLAYRPGVCRDDLVFLDGAPIEVRLVGSLGDLLDGEAIAMESCEPVDVASGWREITTVTGLPLDWLRLDTVDGNSPIPAEPVDVKVLDRGSDDYRLSIDAPAGTQVILGQAYSRGWQAASDLGDLSGTQSLDTQAGWTLTADGLQELHISLAGRSLYRVVTLVSVTLLSILLIVIVGNPRRRDPESVAPRPQWRTVRIPVAALASTVAFLFIVGGWQMLIVVGLSLAALRRRWVTPGALGTTAAGLLGLAAIVTVPPLGPALEPVWPLWPSERELAHELARLAVVLAVVAMYGVVRHLVGRDEANLTNGDITDPALSIRTDHETASAD